MHWIGVKFNTRLVLTHGLFLLGDDPDTDEDSRFSIVSVPLLIQAVNNIGVLLAHKVGSNLGPVLCKSDKSTLFKISLCQVSPLQLIA